MENPPLPSAPSLAPGTMLQIMPGVSLRTDPGGRVVFKLPGDRRLTVDRHAFAVMDAFAEPIALRSALQALTGRVAGRAHGAELMQVVWLLIQAGVLVEAGRVGVLMGKFDGGFNDVPVHLRMLEDRSRTERMIAAIKQVVRPGDIVVEIGTGTGVLAVAAAQAGARHVYTIEAGAMAAVARDVIRRNGVEHQVTLLEGWSSTVELPERGDVLVSETIGNAGFDEDILPIMRDARARLLKPGARIIPAGLSLFALPVEAPAPWMAEQRPSLEAVERWKDWYGVDIGPLVGQAKLAGRSFGVLKPLRETWPPLGDAVRLAHARFDEEITAGMDGSFRWVATGAGRLNAVLLFFTADLGGGLTLGNDPRRIATEGLTHWGNPVWLLDPLTVEAGTSLKFEFSWRRDGEHELEVSRSPVAD